MKRLVLGGIILAAALGTVPQGRTADFPVRSRVQSTNGVGFVTTAGTSGVAADWKVRGPVATNADSVILPASVPDPLEPFNRIVYGFNKVIMTGAVKPTAKVYRLIVIK